MPQAMKAAQSAQVANQAAAKPKIPFAQAAKKHWEQGQTQNNSPWVATNQTYLVPPYGYMSGLYLTIAATGGTSTGATVASADAPWNVLQNILVSDVNGTPIINLDGYSAYLMRLYGGFRLFPPDFPMQSAAGGQPQFTNQPTAPGFSPIQLTSGAGSGNFVAMFELFNEFATDGLGCLPNMDSSSAYKVIATYNPNTTVYTTPPTTLPSLSTQLELFARSRPAPVDPFGNAQETQPPSPGTVSYWTAQTFPLVASNNTLILTRVGNIIRNHILVFRDNSASRSGADSTTVTPVTFEFDWDNGQRYIANTRTLRQAAYEATGVINPAGVLPLLNTYDPDQLAIGEYGEDYIPTVGSTKLQLRFNSSAAGSLTVITNDIVPGPSQSIYKAAGLAVMGS